MSISYDSYVQFITRLLSIMTEEHDVPFIDSELFHNLQHRDWAEKDQVRRQFVETITQNPRVLIPINLGGRAHCALCLIV